MARVFFGGSLFLLEVIGSGVTLGADSSPVSSGVLLLTAVGAIPTALAVAHALFGGDLVPDITADSAE